MQNELTEYKSRNNKQALSPASSRSKASWIPGELPLISILWGSGTLRAKASVSGLRTGCFSSVHWRRLFGGNIAESQKMEVRGCVSWKAIEPSAFIRSTANLTSGPERTHIHCKGINGLLAAEGRGLACSHRACLQTQSNLHAHVSPCRVFLFQIFPGESLQGNALVALTIHVRHSYYSLSFPVVSTCSRFSKLHTEGISALLHTHSPIMHFFPVPFSLT